MAWRNIYCCGGTGGWIRAAYLNMTNPTHYCSWGSSYPGLNNLWGEAQFSEWACQTELPQPTTDDRVCANWAARIETIELYVLSEKAFQLQWQFVFTSCRQEMTCRTMIIGILCLAVDGLLWKQRAAGGSYMYCHPSGSMFNLYTDEVLYARM